MNYFSHYYFDHKEGNHYYNAGLVLPDFARSAAGEKNINTRLIFDEHTQPDFYHLNQGCEAHYATDGFFHNCDFFHHNNKLFDGLFAEHQLPRQGQRLWFLSHILFEMVLDRVLIRLHLPKLNDFYTSLRTVELSKIIEFLALSGKDGSDRFSKFWNGFLEAQYLQYYLIDEKLIYSLNRVLQRAKQPELSNEQVEILTRIIHIAEADIEKQLPAFEKEFAAFKG